MIYGADQPRSQVFEMEGRGNFRPMNRQDVTNVLTNIINEKIKANENQEQEKLESHRWINLINASTKSYFADSYIKH